MEQINEDKPTFGYQAKRLSQARTALMAPHPRGEDASFVEALTHCNHALDTLNLDVSYLDEIRPWLQIIKKHMKAGPDPHPVRVTQMSTDARFELKNAIDYAATRFELWSEHGHKTESFV